MNGNLPHDEKCSLLCFFVLKGTVNFILSFVIVALVGYGLPHLYHSCIVLMLVASYAGGLPKASLHHNGLLTYNCASVLGMFAGALTGLAAFGRFDANIWVGGLIVVVLTLCGLLFSFLNRR